MLNWLRQRKADDPLVQSDARALIECFGCGGSRLLQADHFNGSLIIKAGGQGVQALPKCVLRAAAVWPKTSRVIK